VISPLLSAGKTVVCDRYYDATVVYQGYARGLDTELILRLHRWLFENLKPDITLLLDLPPEVGLSRAWKQIDKGDRDRVETRFEEETLSFHKKVRAGYLEMARLEPERYRIIDASKQADQVRKEIARTLAEEIDKTP
jgi:dTMP kinase